MTAKIVNFPEARMMMVIKRLTDYTVQHFAGIDNVPHLCVKVRHNNGFAWFGLSIMGPNDPSMIRWTSKTEAAVRSRFLEAMEQVIDLAEMDSDINMLMRSIQDVCIGRKRPVMFGGDGNEFIHITAPSNIQIELYRNEVKPESTTYGGYFMTVEYDGQIYPAMVYHRGVILYNYLTKEAVQQLVFEELHGKFTEHFRDISKLTISYQDIMQIPRNRNKWAKVK